MSKILDPQIVHTYIFERKSKQYFRWVVIVFKNDLLRTENGGGYAVVSAISC